MGTWHSGESDGPLSATINLPIRLDLAWRVSATCKKKKNNALDRIGEPLRVLQDGKRVPTGSEAPLSRYGGLCQRSNDPALSQGRGFEGD